MGCLGRTRTGRQAGRQGFEHGHARDEDSLSFKRALMRPATHMHRACSPKPHARSSGSVAPVAQLLRMSASPDGRSACLFEQRPDHRQPSCWVQALTLSSLLPLPCLPFFNAPMFCRAKRRAISALCPSAVNETADPPNSDRPEDDR